MRPIPCVIAAILLILLTPLPARGAEDWTLQTLRSRSQMRPVLASPDGVRIAEGRAAEEGETAPHPLWRLEWRNAAGETRILDGARGQIGITRHDGNRWVLAWTGLELQTPDDTFVRVSLTPTEGAMTEWRLDVRTRAEGWRLVRWRFPMIGVPLGGSGLVQPNGWGLLHNEPESSVTGIYPSHTAAMQWLGALRDSGCFYLAAHDPEAHIKEFAAWPDRERDTLLLSVSAVPEGAGEPCKDYAIPFPIVTAVTPGDWYDAAQLYRRWAVTAPWCQRGPIHARTDIPDWYRNNTLWVLLYGADEVRKPFERWQRMFPFPAIAHWYLWHEMEFDTHYPDYFPAKETFPETLESVRAAGVPVTPYINARLWSPEAASWSERGGADAAVRTERGDLVMEEYGNGHPMAVMCPASPIWQETMATLAGRIFDEFDVNGIYLDQIAAAAAVPCWAPDHGHPPGGGAFWAAGYGAMLDAVERAAGPGRVLLTEENAECWLDHFAGHLMVNTPSGEAELLPLYPAVYGDYTIPFGFQYGMAAAVEDPLPHRLKMARGFVWGAQPGWIDARVASNPKAAAQMSYLDAIAEAHYGYPAALTEGRFLRPPDVHNTPGVRIALQTGGKTIHQAVPAIQAALWQEPDGTLWLAVTNWSEETVKPRIVSSLGGLEVLPAPGTGNWRSVRGSLYGTLKPGTAQLLQMADPKK